MADQLNLEGIFRMTPENKLRLYKLYTRYSQAATNLDNQNQALVAAQEAVNNATRDLLAQEGKFKGGVEVLGFDTWRFDPTTRVLFVGDETINAPQADLAVVSD